MADQPVQGTTSELPIPALADLGFAADNWEDLTLSIGATADVGVLSGALKQLQALNPGGQATALGDAADLISARLRELETGIPNRMLAATATIGLEFQDLDSWAAPDDSDEQTGVVNIATTFCGEDNQWTAT